MVLRSTLTFLLLLSFSYLLAQEDSTKITFNGQVTAWGVGQFENPFGIQLAGRFVPTLLGNFNLTPTSKIDFEASLNINGSANYTGLRYDSVMGQFKPYRVWVRYSTSNKWEVRMGLQKINFGVAKLFRPLMWFDGVDVRDPLQLIYGALGRYYFPNNANIWFWTLIGNKNPKGYETIGSALWQPEIGGRIQIPAGPGQLAISTNFRNVDVHNLTDTVPRNTLLSEKRVGLDGKWDLGIGLWFESSVTKLDANAYNLNTVQDLWNLGADYTFGVGSGLGMTLEYFRYHTGNQFLVNGTAIDVIGSLFTYPVSILDNVSAMVFYIPGHNLVYNYVNWTRTYDNWTLYAIGYWNPDTPLSISQSQGKNLFTGKGIQLMASYNF